MDEPARLLFDQTTASARALYRRTVELAGAPESGGITSERLQILEELATEVERGDDLLRLAHSGRSVGTAEAVHNANVLILTLALAGVLKLPRPGALEIGSRALAHGRTPGCLAMDQVPGGFWDDGRDPLISLVDIYDGLIHPLDWRPALSPAEAVQAVVRSQGSLFPSHLTRAVLETLSAFPPGTLVRLNSGEAALVVKTDRRRPTRPTILVRSDGEGHALPRPRLIDMAGTRDLYITGIISPRDCRSGEPRIASPAP
jgi:hypothetical protein